MLDGDGVLTDDELGRDDAARTPMPRLSETAGRFGLRTVGGR